MLKKFVEFIKAHPYGSAIVAAGTTLAIVYARSGSGSSATPAGVSSADYMNSQAAAVAAGSQYQVEQLQANQAALQSNNQAAVANNQIDAETIIAQIKSQDTLAGILASRDVNLNHDTLEAQTTQAVSLLQAQVAENQIAAATQQTQINANAYVTIATAPYDAAIQIAQINASAHPAPSDNNALYGIAIQNFAAAYPGAPIGAETPGIISDVNNHLHDSFYFPNGRPN